LVPCSRRMRGRSGPVSESKFALKTLKVSNDTLNAIRAPIVWNKPDPGQFDYHYDVAGLYYQPMINYCEEREAGGARRTVDVPDRIRSNLDKVAYERRPDQGDYDKFLTMMYQRRLKEKNSKSIHVANERWSKSKAPTSLNILRGSDNTRDKYLCQIQLLHTGRVAQGRTLGGGPDRARRSTSAEPVLEGHGVEELGAPERPADPRYGPGFERIQGGHSRYLNKGGSGLEMVGIQEPKMQPFTTDEVEKITAEAASKYDDLLKTKEVNKNFLEAATVSDFLKWDSAVQQERAMAEGRKEYKPLYYDTSYIRALKDVQRQVIGSAKDETSLRTMDDVNVFYRGKRVEEVGKYEKAAIRSNMCRDVRLPEFELGYETVDRRCVPVPRA